uniref:Uncharacterized protein n=1 Tax=Chromera velia CCMP2878 TaxID=1169474 RepID=A0A0G4HH70_9ALVE|eukprot:Cvel_27531.t1-p1 / transcript=Cvel_27531.t1 / gene=Cvel_27531 / organism=Chromera_velia_CCMP2878 / gene_product=hypothetical protein / transcript_product=hypothetical protein / location=Cvel_scaffold3453:9008-9861(+) / protein_length=249 / sequence_SO=supercontig / SO=protein_coding / is_pseudo=false
MDPKPPAWKDKVGALEKMNFFTVCACKPKAQPLIQPSPAVALAAAAATAVDDDVVMVDPQPDPAPQSPQHVQEVVHPCLGVISGKYFMLADFVLPLYGDGGGDEDAEVEVKPAEMYEVKAIKNSEDGENLGAVFSKVCGGTTRLPNNPCKDCKNIVKLRKFTARLDRVRGTWAAFQAFIYECHGEEVPESFFALAIPSNREKAAAKTEGRVLKHSPWMDMQGEERILTLRQKTLAALQMKVIRPEWEKE